MPAPARSWGGLPQARHQELELHGRFEAPQWPAGKTLLPHGLGRSYGDSCLNDGGALLRTTGLDRYIAFDAETGVLECEAGASFAEILQLIVPRGWFLPVTPGTQFVTVGGAIANDVHGKNHHRAGSFGAHVESFELLRSDGRLLRCSPVENTELFAATIGGLGLTGLVLTARFRLLKIPSPLIRGEVIKFGGLAEFFELSAESNDTHEYTVSWVDCMTTGRSLGRGLFSRGNHCAVEDAGTHVMMSELENWPEARWRARRRPGVPFTPPISMVNRLSVAAFNPLYYARQRAQRREVVWSYEPFFYPLDGISNWNRMYGPRGFYQYQCALPLADASSALAEMMKRISTSGEASFLAVLKMFGDEPSPGMLSFPRPGATLAVDFPNRGERTLRLLDSLDEVTRAAGGAVYPAKDARMSAADFQRAYPRAREFSRHIDPAFSSSFWRRVSEGLQA